MDKKINRINKLNEFKSYGLSIVEDVDFIYAKKKIKCIAKDGYIVYAKLVKLRMGENPTIFGKSNPYTIYNIMNWIKLNEINLTLLSKLYKSPHKKLKFICGDCGSDWECSWANLQQGKRCRNCSYSKRGLSKRTNLNDVSKTINSRGFDFLDVEYTTLIDFVPIIDNNGYIGILQYSNFIKGHDPSFFHPSNPYTIQNIRLWLSINKVKLKLISTEYLGCESKLIFYCEECDNYCRISFAKLKITKLCNMCNMSYGEKMISNILSANDIVYIYEKRFNNLRGVGDTMLSYDFYLPNLNFLIEYQGEQHEKPIELWGGKKQFEKQQEHDDRKRIYAKENNYKLLEIWYYDYNRIEEILYKVIN